MAQSTLNLDCQFTYSFLLSSTYISFYHESGEIKQIFSGEIKAYQKSTSALGNYPASMTSRVHITAFTGTLYWMLHKVDRGVKAQGTALMLTMRRA